MKCYAFLPCLHERLENYHTFLVKVALLPNNCGCNFLNNLIDKTLIKYRGPWLTFLCMFIFQYHDDVRRNCIFDDTLFLTFKWNHCYRSLGLKKLMVPSQKNWLESDEKKTCNLKKKKKKAVNLKRKGVFLIKNMLSWFCLFVSFSCLESVNLMGGCSLAKTKQ